MAERRPDRVLGRGHDEFWAHCGRDELWFQRCNSCHLLNWPPVEDACERCASSALTWEKVSGRGEVVSWCTFERAYYDELPVPWETILVELEEGPLVISNPLGFTVDELAADMRVAVAFIDCEDRAGSFRLPVFELAAPPKEEE